MRHPFRLAGLAIAACFLMTSDAFAWGPATHIGLGSEVLAQLALLPASIAAILAKNRLAYLHGNIAADVVFAKRLSRVKQSCHHWSTAFRLLNTASNNRSRAFAYGYLSHLAADTVAHGKFVPRQILMSGARVNSGHLYWELRADASANADSWKTLNYLLQQDHHSHHVDLADQLHGTFFSYELNRLMFDRINAFAVRKSFRRTIGVVDRCSRWYLSPSVMAGHQKDCVDRIHSILTQGSQSPLLREDPNGTSALMRVHVRRKELRRLKRRGFSLMQRRLETSVAL